jgi:hypothetical protein
LAAVLALNEESGALVLDVDGLEEKFMPEVALAVVDPLVLEALLSRIMLALTSRHCVGDAPLEPDPVPWALA